MASIIFSHAKVMVNKARKAANKASRDAAVGNEKEVYKQAYDLEMANEFALFDKYLEVSKQLHDRYLDAHGPQSYMITIRPDDSKANFLEFKEKVTKYLNRACFISYKYSFEQKGTDPTTIGKGFHVHIVAQMTQRSKGEVLRDTKSSWKNWIDTGLIAENCINVLTTKTPDKIVNDYLIEYKSDDDHKIVTKAMDAIWRADNNLQELYES